MAERFWGKYQPISEDKRQRVIYFLKNCPEMSFTVIAARVEVSKASVRDINRETHARPYTRPEKDLEEPKGSKPVPWWYFPRRFLSDEDVLAIRVMLANGVVQREIARKFSVTIGTISQIAVGRTHRKVRPKSEFN